MTRRKREIIGLTNERDFPDLVERMPYGLFVPDVKKAPASLYRGFK